VKLILSRKGFDSAAGGCPSPILDDGSMLSLPIPDRTSPIRYEDINLYGHDLGAVVADLTKGRVRPYFGAHLDPDLVATAHPRTPDWRPVFGQAGNEQTVLARKRVGDGDLFLFFGWFRRAQRSGGQLRFVPGAPDLHVIWGWLQIAKVVPVARLSPEPWMRYHPHVAAGEHRINNTLYISRETLAIDGTATDVPGAGGFRTYDDRLRLTAPGRSRSQWRLPGWFAPTPPRPPLGYHGDPKRWQHAGDHVVVASVGRGQEFVLDTDWYPEARPWIYELLQQSEF
jgi:hypothetical protein